MMESDNHIHSHKRNGMRTNERFFVVGIVDVVTRIQSTAAQHCFGYTEHHIDDYMPGNREDRAPLAIRTRPHNERNGTRTGCSSVRYSMEHAQDEILGWLGSTNNARFEGSLCKPLQLNFEYIKDSLEILFCVKTNDYRPKFNYLPKVETVLTKFL